METMDKCAAILYILRSNPLCEDCARGNLEQVRKAAGLYQLLKDIDKGSKNSFTPDELKGLMTEATSF